MKASTDTSVASIVADIAGNFEGAGTTGSSWVEVVNRKEICGGERAKEGATAVCVLKQCRGNDLNVANIALQRSKKGWVLEPLSFSAFLKRSR